MEILDILEKNSDEGKKRLGPVNLYLDLVDLSMLQSIYPNLNLSRFFRDVISAAISDEEKQGYILMSMNKEKDEVKELEKKDGKA